MLIEPLTVTAATDPFDEDSFPPAPFFGVDLGAPPPGKWWSLYRWQLHYRATNVQPTIAPPRVWLVLGTAASHYDTAQKTYRMPSAASTIAVGTIGSGGVATIDNRYANRDGAIRWASFDHRAQVPPQQPVAFLFATDVADPANLQTGVVCSVTLHVVQTNVALSRWS